MYIHIYILIDDNDDLFIASDYPYTYTDLSRLLSNICNNSNKDKVHQAVLCKTLAGNACPFLIITNFRSKEEEIDQRPAVILTGRVHPG